MFFKKKQERKEPDNAYALLNKELERMWRQFDAAKAGTSADNMNIFWNRIKELQDAMLEALEKQPAHAEQISDLQNTVAEMLLLTETESR